METSMDLPGCKKCGTGTLLPLSDYGRDGAPIMYKAWACSNPDCGFNVRSDNGDLSSGRTVGPPLFESLEVLGRPVVLDRVRAALDRLGG